MNPRITLEQWQALVAVVDAGGYAQAAEQLHKSQSSVTYLVQKLESLLDVKAFEIKGRKAALTARADLAITPIIPQGFTGALLMPLRMILVAHPDHPLHKLGRPLMLRYLRAHRQLVVRETDALRATKTQIEATQRWTVSHMSTAIFAASMGFGYGWYPEERIRGELQRGSLKPLPLRDGSDRAGPFYLVYADRENAGPGTLRLAEIIHQMVKEECASAGAARAS